MKYLPNMKNGSARAWSESIAAVRVRLLSIGNRRFAITPGIAFAACRKSFSLKIDLGFW